MGRGAMMQWEYPFQNDSHLRRSGKEFFKKRGSNLEKMRRDVQRFETELGKAKEILHGKKQSGYADIRGRRSDLQGQFRTSMYEKSRKPKKRRKEMPLTGNFDKSKRARSKNKDLNDFRSKYSILGEKGGRDQVDGQWKKRRAARTMDKRKAKRSFVPQTQNLQYSSRHIPQLPKISKDYSMRDSIYQDHPNKKIDPWAGYPKKKRKLKDLKLEDLYAKKELNEKRRGRSKTPTRKSRRSELGLKKTLPPQLPQISPKDIRKASFLKDSMKEKQRGIVNTRKMKNEKEKMRSKQSFHNEVNIPQGEIQNSVGPYHSSKTDNTTPKLEVSPKVMLKFAVVNGLENGKEKTGQDAVLVYKFKVKGEQFHVFGVFDGHGTHGHHVSMYIKKNLVSVLKKELFQYRNLRSIKEILEESIKILHRQIYEITKKYQQSFSNK
jgi:hypothetical protein